MKNASRRLLMLHMLGCAAVLVTASSAAAQDIATGTRVRITYDAQRSGVMRIARGGSHQAVGTLVRRDSNAYVVASPSRETVVAENLVRRVEISQGRHRNVPGGALLGLGAGALATATLHFLLVAPLGGDWEHNKQVYLLIPAGTAVVGAALAYVLPQERWQRR